MNQNYVSCLRWAVALTASTVVTVVVALVWVVAGTPETAAPVAVFSAVWVCVPNALVAITARAMRRASLALPDSCPGVTSLAAAPPVSFQIVLGLVVFPAVILVGWFNAGDGHLRSLTIPLVTVAVAQALLWPMVVWRGIAGLRYRIDRGVTDAAQQASRGQA